MKLALVTAFAFAAACSAGTFAYLDAAGQPAMPRPPVASPPRVLGLSVGATSFERVAAAAKRAGLVCEDASLAAAMIKAHAHAKVDTTKSTGSGMAAHLKLLSDPAFFQVRYACEGVVAKTVGLAAASDVKGRLLFVHGSASEPLQLVSYQRHHKDLAAARADLAATLAALEARYGEPAITQGGSELQPLAPIEREWHVAGTIVKLSALSFGARGTAISEEIKLPSVEVKASS